MSSSRRYSVSRFRLVSLVWTIFPFLLPLLSPFASCTSAACCAWLYSRNTSSLFPSSGALISMCICLLKAPSFRFFFLSPFWCTFHLFVPTPVRFFYSRLHCAIWPFVRSHNCKFLFPRHNVCFTSLDAIYFCLPYSNTRLCDPKTPVAAKYHSLTNNKAIVYSRRSHATARGSASMFGAPGTTAL